MDNKAPNPMLYLLYLIIRDELKSLDQDKDRSPKWISDLVLEVSDVYNKKRK